MIKERTEAKSSLPVEQDESSDYPKKRTAYEGLKNLQGDLCENERDRDACHAPSLVRAGSGHGKSCIIPNDKNWATNWSHVNDLLLNIKNIGKQPTGRWRASHGSLDPFSRCASSTGRYHLSMALYHGKCLGMLLSAGFAAGCCPLAAQRP